MTKKRIILRLVTFVLTLLLAFYAVPVYAYASDSLVESSAPVCDEQKVEQNEEQYFFPIAPRAARRAALLFFEPLFTFLEICVKIGCIMRKYVHFW